MIKRPKPGETEEDLLEFQRQFLAGQAEPSARVVVKPGEKRKPPSADSRHERDVVQLKGKVLFFQMMVICQFCNSLPGNKI